MNRYSVFVVLALMLGAVFASQASNTLTIGTSQEPTVVGSDYGNLNAVGSQAIKSEHQLWTTAGMYRVDLDTVLQPNQVTEIPTVENGRMTITERPDGDQTVTLHLTLRDDLRWSDGEPITTADVQFYYDLGKAPGMPTASPDFWARVSLEVIDGLNFRVTLDPAQSSDLVGSPMEALPVHVMGPAWAEIQATVSGLNPETDAGRITEIYRGFFTEFGSSQAVNAGRMVYSGPFIPVRWTPGSAMEMVRNPYFHDHPANQDAYIQRVIYRYITDTNALLFSIVSGAVDVTSQISITFDQALSPQIQARAGERYDVWFVPGAVWEHLEVNQFTNLEAVRDLQLADLRTRRAILHAIDRASMVDALFDGAQPVSHSNVSPLDPNYNPDVPQYAYDPEESARLLAELGWTKGGDGFLTRTTEDGRVVRFELEFVTTAGNVVRERQQQFISEDLRRVGIQTRITNAPSGVVFAPEHSQRAYDGAWQGMFMFAWLSSQASSLNAAGYLCRNAPTPVNNYSGQNYAGTCVPEYDAVRDRAVAELDPAAARPLYQEMQAIFAENLMALPLFFRTNPYVVSRGVVNYIGGTFSNGFGYPPPQPQFVGWEANGAVKLFDQADYAVVPGQD